MPYVVLTQIITLDPSSCIMFSLHQEIKLFVSSQLIIECILDYMLKWLQELPLVARAIVHMNRPPSTTAIITTHIRLTLALVERFTISNGGHHGSGACDSQIELKGHFVVHVRIELKGPSQGH